MQVLWYIKYIRKKIYIFPTYVVPDIHCIIPIPSLNTNAIKNLLSFFFIWYMLQNHLSLKLNTIVRSFTLRYVVHEFILSTQNNVFLHFFLLQWALAQRGLLTQISLSVVEYETFQRYMCALVKIHACI